ncbi:D-alanyl-D-alanine carboxypeptidase family protein [Bacillus taeanensis]|uniref:LysM domain-containing protein n=1 Tax=Bacillus taeanensis TaxID=273032 RepID=A0A366XYZ1_9BACI|nr:D-alanyl-D-alanine carboxypeptidase family protein [Bacillus taeanensis]RBW69384.1 hypothetical protein DS031_12170 [Bacillus taeanensis]
MKRTFKKKAVSLSVSLVAAAGLIMPTISYAHEKDDILLVNKDHSLSSEFVPNNLAYPDVPFSSDKEKMQAKAASALEEMFQAAENEGIQLYAVSGYRSYHYQEDLHAYFVDQYGREQANRVSAKAGESEHQTGLIMDVSSPAVNYELIKEFGNTAAGEWLENNAADYGFIIRYPQGKESITNYDYEPWHLRYIGEDHAKEIEVQNITLEEYLSQDSSDNNSSYYIVQPGDTFWEIANSQGVSLDKLLELNSDIAPKRLQVGMKVNLPGSSNGTPNNPDHNGNLDSNVSYTIKPGDTFWGIASQYSGVTVEELENANSSIDPYDLRVGTEIVVPTKTSNDNGSQEELGTASGNVWIHLTPDFKSSSRIGLLYEGEEVKIIGEANNMYKIKDGYVSKYYITK